MFTISITEVPQATTHPLFNQAGDSKGEATEAVPPPIEHARIQVATLDVAALIALIYAKPKKQRADAGKPRAAK